MTNLDIEIELEQEQSIFDILEDYEGDGYYAVKLQEFDFPIEAYLFVGPDGGLYIDENKSFKTVKPHRIIK